jgi:hypothetical protein
MREIKIKVNLMETTENKKACINAGFLIMVGAAGFELATLCSQSRCATRLRYAPTNKNYNPEFILFSTGY